jgi:hypothetical protein
LLPQSKKDPINLFDSQHKGKEKKRKADNKTGTYSHTMEANIDNEEDQQEIAEQERIAAAATSKRRHLKINSVLERKEKFPLRNRNKIDVLIKEFLKNLGNDIHELLCDIDVENYDGLDSDRDSEEEVETALRIFPKVLSRKGGCFNVNLFII